MDMEERLRVYGLHSSDDTPHFNDWVCESFFDVTRFDNTINRSIKAKLEELGPLWVFRKIPTYVSDGLPHKLISQEPPTIDFFLSLPDVSEVSVEDLKATYMHYVVVLEHPTDPNTPVYIIIGSCSAFADGSRNRVGQWQRKFLLPKFVDIKVEEGFEIVHMGILDMMDVPTNLRGEEQPAIRCFVLLMETAYTYTFWSVYQGEGRKAVAANDKQMAFMCPWTPSELEYRGLSSHSPASEHVLYIELTAEQLHDKSVEVKKRSAARTARKLARQRKGRALLKSIAAGEELDLDTEDEKCIQMAQQRANHYAREKFLIERGEQLFQLQEENSDHSFDTDEEISIQLYKRKVDKLSTSRKTHALAMEAIQKHEAGELDEPDTENEKLIQKAVNYRNKNTRAIQRERQGRELIAQIDAGELEDPTSEQEKAINKAKSSQARAARYRSTQQSRRKLMVAFDAGDLENPTPEEEADIEKARSEKADRDARNKKNQELREQRWELMRQFDAGEIEDPTSEQERDIKKAKEEKAYLDDRAAKRAARRELVKKADSGELENLTSEQERDLERGRNEMKAMSGYSQKSEIKKKEKRKRSL